jgi:pyrroloquinoline quinone biosynthesis protein B
MRFLLWLALPALGCAGTKPSTVGTAGAAAPVPELPYALVLGTAQDGGLPQIGCEEPRCAHARRDPARGRLVASLLIADPRSGKRFLIDATSDLAHQVERASGHPPTRRGTGPRPPLFDAIFLTHAHVGHYSGLLQLGKEAYGAERVPLHVSARMAAFLRANAPWSLLVEGGHVELFELEPGRSLALADDLLILPIAVPHRDELSDTLAFVVRGPGRSLLYVPDTDGWERWSTPIEELLAIVDRAYLDGTFFDAGEVPGRDLSQIPHPFVRASLERFGALPPEQRAKIRFLHLNHTNPACDPDSAASAAIRAAGMDVAAEGEIFGI